MPGPAAACEVDVAAFTLGLRRARQSGPCRAVVGALHFESARSTALPVDHEPAVLVLAAEVELQPGARVAGGTAPARRWRCGEPLFRFMAGLFARCEDARRILER